jgi:hypothetical protein
MAKVEAKSPPMVQIAKGYQNGCPTSNIMKGNKPKIVDKVVNNIGIILALKAFIKQVIAASFFLRFR